MFTGTNNTTHTPINSNGTGQYAKELADIPDLQVQNNSISIEYVDQTGNSLSIVTDSMSFIQSGNGNDTITDNSKTGYVVIDPGGGTNNIQASSNPANHDTIIVDAEADAPLTDVITGLKAGDNVLIKDLTALSPNDFTNAPAGLTLAIHLPAATSPAANIVLSGYTTSDFAIGGRLHIGTPFTSTNPDVSSYQLLQVVH